MTAHIFKSTITSRNQGGGDKKAGLPPSVGLSAFARNAIRIKSTYRILHFVTGI